MSERLSDEDLHALYGHEFQRQRMLDSRVWVGGESEAIHRATAALADAAPKLVAEVRERRAAEQRVRAVLAEWDETEPEEGWGRMAEEITAALDA